MAPIEAQHPSRQLEMGGSEHYKWREHAGHGYWRGRPWVDISDPRKPLSDGRLSTFPSCMSCHRPRAAGIALGLAAIPQCNAQRNPTTAAAEAKA